MDFVFSEDNLYKIKNNILPKYPVKKAAIMPVLYLAQEQNGYISTEVMKTIGELLSIPLEDVIGVVTFYTMYFQKPMGKHHIQVCTNVSCMLRGGYELFNAVKEKLNLKHLEVSADQKFSLEEVECMGACGGAPMVAINEDFYENITEEKLIELINSLK